MRLTSATRSFLNKRKKTKMSHFRKCSQQERDCNQAIAWTASASMLVLEYLADGAVKVIGVCNDMSNSAYHVYCK
jgi:hypothetical protein